MLCPYSVILFDLIRKQHFVQIIVVHSFNRCLWDMRILLFKDYRGLKELSHID
jgi:hypothetical protein